MGTRPGISPPMVGYSFEGGRGDDCVDRHLAGFTGILQANGYPAIIGPPG